MNKIEELQKLKSLLDQGAINTEEFNSLKNKILHEKIEAVKSETKILSQPIVIDHTNSVALRKKPTKKYVKKNIEITQEYQEGNSATQGLLGLGMIASLILSFVFWLRYDIVWLFFITLFSYVGSIYLIGKFIPKVLKRNIYLGTLLLVCIFLIAVPIGDISSSSGGSPSNSSSSSSTTNYRYCAKHDRMWNPAGIDKECPDCFADRINKKVQKKINGW